MENIQMARIRLGNVREIPGQIGTGNGPFDGIRVIADAWDGSGQSAVWDCFVDSFDFRSGSWAEKDGICTLPLKGDARNGRQFVCRRLASVSKLRRRVEDRLRKGTDLEVFTVSQSLGIRID